MGFLNKIGNFLQKNVLDKTSLDETIGGAFNSAKTNLSNWANPQVRRDLVNNTVVQPTTNFAQNKVIDPVKKLKNRVGSILNNAAIAGGVTPNLNDPIKTPMKYNLQAWDNVRKTVPNIRVRPDLPSIGEASQDLVKQNWGKEMINDVRPLTQLLPKKGMDFANNALDKISPIMETTGQWAKNNIVSALDTGGDLIRNANKLGNGSGTDKIEGAFGLPFAATKALLLKNPLFQTLNAVSATPEWGNASGLNATRDFVKGAVQTMGGGNENIGNNYESRIKMNVPIIGEVKPFEAVGSMYGFTKQPFFQKSSKWLSTINQLKIMKSPVFNYLMTRGAKGSVEGIIQAFAEMPEGLTPQEKEKFLIDQIKFGALSEVVTDKPAEMVGQGLKRLLNGTDPQIKGAVESTKKAYHDVRGKGGKWIKDLKRAITDQYPNVDDKYIPNLELMESNIKKGIYDGKGILPSEYQATKNLLKMVEETRASNKMKSQGGFINFGVLADAGQEGVEKVANWIKPKKPIADMSKTEIMSNLSKAERALRQYDAEIASKTQKSGELGSPFNKKFLADMAQNRKRMAQDVDTWTRKLAGTMEGKGTFSEFSAKQDFDAETKRLIDNGTDPFEARFRSPAPKKIADLPKTKTVENMSTKEISDIFKADTPKVEDPELKMERLAGASKVQKDVRTNEVQSMVNYARTKGYQDSQIGTMLKNKGYDISGTDLKGQPTTIKSIFENRKKTYSETLKPTVDELPPKPLTSNRPEPSDGELTRSDYNAEQLKRGDVTPKSESQNKPNQPDYAKYYEGKKTDMSAFDGSRNGAEGKNPQKSVEKPVTEPKIDKFAGQNSRITHKDTSLNEIADPELRAAIRDAKSFDDWAINEKGMETLPAKSDQKWQRVAEIEAKLGNKGKPASSEKLKTARQKPPEPIGDDVVNTEKESGKKELERLINRHNMAGTQATLSVDKAGLLDIDKTKTDDIISAIEKTDGKADGDYTPEELSQIQSVKDFWVKARAIGNDMGLNIQKTKDYFTHIYEQKLNSKGVGKKTLGQKTTFANERKFATYQEALEKAGLTKAFDNIAAFGEMYMKKNLTTRAKVDFVKNMPWKTEAQVGKDSRYKTVEAIPGMNLGADQRYLPKELAEMVDNYFHPKDANKVLEKAGNISKFFQDIKLNAGAMFTPANYFGITQGIKEFTTELGDVALGRKNPFKMHSPKNFFRSFSKNAQMDFNRANAKEIIEIQSRYKLSTEYNVEDMLDGGFLQNIKDKNWGKAMSAAMETATFKRFISANTISTYKEAKNRFIKDGMSNKEAIDTSLELVGKLYGLSKTTSAITGNKLQQLWHNKDVANSFRALILAKDYKASMGKMWGNMVAGIKNPKDPKNAGLLAYAVGMGITYTAQQAVNFISTGHLMEQNPEQLQDKMIMKLPGKGNLTIATIPGVGYLPKTTIKIIKHLFEQDYEGATKDASSVLSIPAKFIMEVGMNEDYFGNPIVNSSDTGVEKMVKVGSKALKDAISPYVQGLKSAISIGKKVAGDDTLDDEGEIKDSEINDVLKAAEMPVGYISDKKIETLNYFDAKKSITNKLTPEDKAIYDKIAMKETDFGAKQRDKVADAQDMINHPEVMFAIRDIALATAQKNKTEADPLYSLADEQLKTYYQIQGLTNNSDAQKALKEKNADWYKPLSTARGAFFDELISSGKMKKQDNGYPEQSAELKSITDAYYKLPKGTGARSAFIKQHPELLEYWEKVNDYNNKVGEAFGIEAKPFNDFSSGSGSGGSWDKYYADKAKFALLNKLKSQSTKTPKLATQLKDILKQSSSKDNSRKIADILAKNIWKNEKTTFKLPSKAKIK